VHAPDAAERAARRGLHTINLDPTEETRACSERYRAVWRELHGEAPLPKLGLGRFIVVADTTRRPWRSRAAPIRNGTRRSRSCRAGMGSRSSIRGQPSSMRSQLAARDLPGRPRASPRGSPTS
jgi:alkanesulfonate monooxygenase SsuD/methylene tetrahydromethanopterin reductase-like flavin-dependent oxidoreductase (luciferase family)